MLVVTPGSAPPIADYTVRDLPGLLNPGDVLVVNDTRVIPARLYGTRTRGAAVAKLEVLLHLRTGADQWWAFAKPAKRLALGDRVRFEPEDADLTAEVLGRGDDGQVLLGFSRSGASLMAAITAHGHMPLPPYIAGKRADTADDRVDYQTIFAEKDGAVAAPTAGLHMTDRLLAALDARGVGRATVTLHVGAGTFLPVKAADTNDHTMHAEWGEVSAAAVAAIQAGRARGNAVVAVGTTSLRVLESAAANGQLAPFSGETRLFITPGYRFAAVDRLMTNFHLPRSTLFMLVAAFSGLETMHRAYAHAISSGYRFYSYGDACLLTRAEHAP